MKGPGYKIVRTGDETCGEQKRTLLDGLAGGSDDRLDLVRVDETGDVGSRDLGGGEAVAIISDDFQIQAET